MKSLIVSHLVSPTFYGIFRFIITFTRAHNLYIGLVLNYKVYVFSESERLKVAIICFKILPDIHL